MAIHGLFVCGREPWMPGHDGKGERAPFEAGIDSRKIKSIPGFRAPLKFGMSLLIEGAPTGGDLLAEQARESRRCRE